MPNPFDTWASIYLQAEEQTDRGGKAGHRGEYGLQIHDLMEGVGRSSPLLSFQRLLPEAQPSHARPSIAIICIVILHKSHHPFLIYKHQDFPFVLIV